MNGKRYPEEFKIEAVKQVVDRGHSVSSVATRLDITTFITFFLIFIQCFTSISRGAELSLYIIFSEIY